MTGRPGRIVGGGASGSAMISAHERLAAGRRWPDGYYAFTARPASLLTRPTSPTASRQRSPWQASPASASTTYGTRARRSASSRVRNSRV